MTDRQTDEHRDLADVPEMGQAAEKVRVSRRAWIGRFLGPALAVIAYFTLPTGENALSQGGVATVSVGILLSSSARDT